MKIISDHLKILSCLSKNNYSISELTNILEIPNFKIRRYIADIEYILKEKSIDNIHIRLSNNPKLIQNFRDLQSFTPEERELYIITNFLTSDVVNLNQLSEDISVTRRTLANDAVNLKLTLQKFNLKICSLNSFGISLIGNEKDKRNFFYIYLFKITHRLKFLPQKFEDELKILSRINKEYGINKIIEDILSVSYIHYHPMSIKYLETISYIAIIRQNFSINITELPIKQFDENTIIYLKSLKFYSIFEIEAIAEYCYKRRKDNFFIENKLLIKEVTDLITSLNQKFNLELELNEEFLIRLVFMISIIKYKQEFNEKDFYPFNNNVAENYLNEFIMISKFIKEHFFDIDSFDLSIITIMILNKLHLDLEKKIENLENIIVVYNFLDNSFLINACKELGLSKLIQKINFVPTYKLDQYLSVYQVKGIILFESIKINNNYKDITCVKINLPITKLDKVKLSAFLK